jgi:hypothetical protein
MCAAVAGDGESHRYDGHGAVVRIMIMYSVAGSALAIVAEVAGAGIGYVLFASLAGPPFLHLLYALGRFKGLF